MLLAEFPISGNLREVLLTIEWIFSFIIFEMGLIFLLRYRHQKKEIRNYQEMGFSSLFFGYSLMYMWYIISDYYSSDQIVSPFFFWPRGSMRFIFLNCGYFTIMIGAFFFIYFIEKNQILLFRKHFFSIIFFIISITFAIFFLIDITITQFITYLFWPWFVIFLLVYLTNFARKVKNREKLFMAFLKVVPGFGLLVIGFLFTTDFLIDLFGLIIRLYGAIFQLISLGLIALFFFGLPPFSEFNWQDNIEEIYIIASSGIPLYHKSFLGTHEDHQEDLLVSGAITSVNIMLKELIRPETEGISVIKKREKTVITYAGEGVAGVIFCTEEFNMIKLFLKDFVEKFELLYSQILKAWDGDLTIFLSVDNMVNELIKK